MADILGKTLEPIEGLLGRLNVDSVFGKAVTVGDAVVIPVADVTVGFGYGFGEGEGLKVATTGEGEPTEPGTGHGSGGGGGAGGRAKPRGYIRIADGEVTYEPIVDQGRLAIAGLLTAAWFVFWVTKTVRTFAKS